MRPLKAIRDFEKGILIHRPVIGYINVLLYTTLEQRKTTKHVVTTFLAWCHDLHEINMRTIQLYITG
jgi:hypothetical protein